MANHEPAIGELQDEIKARGSRPGNRVPCWLLAQPMYRLFIDCRSW